MKLRLSRGVPYGEGRAHAMLAVSCLSAVFVGVLLELLSPVDDAGAIIVVPVAVASLLLDWRIALAVVALACAGEVTTLHVGAGVAHVLADTTGLVVTFPVCRALGTMLGIRGAHVAREDTAELMARRLTAREAEVIGLVLAGLSAKEIARRLALADRTIESHTANAYAKLGVHDRAAVGRLFPKGVPTSVHPGHRDRDAIRQ